MCRPLSVEELAEYEPEVIDELLTCPECGYHNHPREVWYENDAVDPSITNYSCKICDYPIGNSKTHPEFRKEGKKEEKVGYKNDL